MWWPMYTSTRRIRNGLISELPRAYLQYTYICMCALCIDTYILTCMWCYLGIDPKPWVYDWVGLPPGMWVGPSMCTEWQGSYSSTSLAKENLSWQASKEAREQCWYWLYKVQLNHPLKHPESQRPRHVRQNTKRSHTRWLKPCIMRLSWLPQTTPNLSWSIPYICMHIYIYRERERATSTAHL